MPIVTGDIVFRLSGGASNTDPSAALGGAKSTVAGGIINKTALNNIFDDTSGDEGAAGDVEYRCIYIENAHGTLTWGAIKAWIETQSASPSSAFALGLDPAGVGGTATTVADEDTAPAGVTFSSPADKASGITVPDLAAGADIPLWLRKTITAGAAAANSDGPGYRIQGDTGADP